MYSRRKKKSFIMVSFRSLVTTILLTFVALPSVIAVTSGTVISNIQSLKDRSVAMQAPANEVNIVNAWLFIAGLGPIPGLINQFKSFNEYTSGLNAAYLNSPPFPDSDTTAAGISTAFRDFATQHRILLNILLGNARISSGGIPELGDILQNLSRQIRDVLVYGQGNVTTFKTRIVSLVNAAADQQVEGAFLQLSELYPIVIDAYTGNLA
ncbi:hypothetical protein QBC35DRAFT_505112 [Podospora australis]|uniref:Uncharacterized protein n=1 Tax=Podospora australis TaxID=1536484 RepID=A0AAN7AGA4_9PEZI|nr:hypothetical protein QBC35DRAFT_505112 [Podospora australis]